MMRTILHETVYRRKSILQPSDIAILFGILFVVLSLAAGKRLPSDVQFIYFVLILSNTVAIMLLLYHFLRNEIVRILPFLVMFVIFFVGDFVKFYWIMIDPSIVESQRVTGELAYSSYVMLDSYFLISYGFLSFTLAVLAVLRFFPAKLSEVSALTRATARLSRLSNILAVVVIGLSIFLLYLTEHFNIGYMGVANVNLPFQLAGVIFYTRLIILPVLQSLWLYTALVSRNSSKISIVFVVTALYALITALLTTSRGTFLFGVFPLGFVLILYNKKYLRKNLWFFVVILIITVLGHGFVSDLRSELVYTGGDAVQALVYQFQHGSLGDPVESAQRVIFRVTGVDSLIAMSGPNTPLLSIGDLVVGGVSPTSYFTHVIQGYPVGLLNSSATSLFGWFYLIQGQLGLIIGVFVFTFGVGVIWQYLNNLSMQRKWYGVIAVQSVFLTRLLSYASDGVLETLPKVMSVMIAALLLVRWIASITFSSSQYRLPPC